MKRLIVFLAIALMCFSLPALAAEEGKKRSTVSIKLTGSGLSKENFSNSGGSAGVSTGVVSLKALGLSFSYEGRHYNWSDVDALSFGNGTDKPWENLHRLALGFEKVGRINQDWGYMAAITGTSSFEKEMDGSFGAALRGGFMYSINENWTTLFGARVFTNKIRSSAMPFLGFMYEKYDSDGAGLFLNLGAPSSEVGYAFSKKAKLRWNINLDGRTYRLKDDSTVSEKGYMQTSGFLTGIHFDWNPNDTFSLSLGPEYSFSREMKFFKKNGDRIHDKVKQDGAFGGRLQLGVKF